MKTFLILIISLLSTISFAADKMLRCEYVGGAPCQCQFERTIIINDDGPHHGQTRKLFIIKNCPGDIAARLSRTYWATSMNPDNHRTSQTQPSVEFPKNDFNSSPFAAPLTNGLSWLFSKHEESTLQAYLDNLRSWAPIDPQMAQDVENFRNSHTDALGQMERGDRENYEYLQELTKLSQNLNAESQLPERDRPTPLPNGIDAQIIRQQYKSLYKHAQNNDPLKLNQEVNQLLKRLNLMDAKERTFHRTELARTFLNKDLTFKSLPYVQNPGLNLKSRPDSVSGAAIRSKINGLMAAESQAMQNMHNECNSVECKNAEETLKRAKRSIGQIYKSIEFQDRVKDYLVNSAEFQAESSQLIQDFTQQLGSVTNDHELNGLLDKTDDAIAKVQLKRIGVKEEALESWGGDSRYSKEEVSGLAKTSGQLVEYSKTLSDKASADFYRGLGEDALDLAMDFTPGVSTVKDFYELVSGRTLIGKEDLGVADRSIRAVSIAVDIATVGVGGRVAKVVLDKSFDGLKTFIKSPMVEEMASKLIDSAAKLGATTGAKILSFAQSFKSNPGAIGKVEEITTNIIKSPKALKAFEQTPVGRPAFYMNADGKAVPATAYRHFKSSDIDFLKENVIKNGKIPEHPSTGNYITFERFEDAAEASSKLQVPHDARYRVTVDTLNNVNDISIPRGNWGAADWLEPITKDMHEYGVGGASQAVTKSEISNILEVKDLISGEVLYKRVDI